ncbi:MAG: hypothetical protein WD557_06615 [Dehalococcoidia bacterium]
MSRYRIRIAGALAGLAAITASLLPTMALADTPTEQIPASLQSAIKAEIESKGHKYAGLCRVVNEQPQIPVGEYCAFVLSIEHDIAEVSYGAVLSDQITRVNFHSQNGTWVKEGTSTPPPPTPSTPTTPTNPGTPKPPATGDGLADDSGSDNSAALLGAAAVAVAGLGVAGVAIARKR